MRAGAGKGRGVSESGGSRRDVTLGSSTKELAQQAAQLRRASTFTGSAAGPHLWHLQTRLPALLLHHHRVPGCSQLVRVRKRSWPAVSQMVSLTRFPPSSTTLALKSTPAGNRAGKERKKTG